MPKPTKPGDDPEGVAADPESDVHRNQTRTSQADTLDSQLVARRAYERFRTRGGEHGRDQEDWFEAERELNKDRRD